MEWISLYVERRCGFGEKEVRTALLYMGVGECVPSAVAFVELVRILAWAGDRRWRGMGELVEIVGMMHTLALSLVKSVCELSSIFSWASNDVRERCASSDMDA